MLEITPKFKLTLPKLHLPKRMQFEPVVAEADELIEAIEADRAAHDDDWQLSERPDTTELVDYLSKVENDFADEPE